jgi:hypothetical protein
LLFLSNAAHSKYSNGSGKFRYIYTEISFRNVAYTVHDVTSWAEQRDHAWQVFADMQNV